MLTQCIYSVFVSVIVIHSEGTTALIPLVILVTGLLITIILIAIGMQKFDGLTNAVTLMHFDHFSYHGYYCRDTVLQKRYSKLNS